MGLFILIPLMLYRLLYTITQANESWKMAGNRLVKITQDINLMSTQAQFNT